MFEQILSTWLCGASHSTGGSCLIRTNKTGENLTNQVYFELGMQNNSRDWDVVLSKVQIKANLDLSMFALSGSHPYPAGTPLTQTVRPNPHRTRVCKLECKSFDVACVQCGHPHSHQLVPFVCIARARPVWMRPKWWDTTPKIDFPFHGLGSIPQHPAEICVSRHRIHTFVWLLVSHTEQTNSVIYVTNSDVVSPW